MLIIVNGLVIAIGAIIGTLLNQKLNSKYLDSTFFITGIVTILIGIEGVIKGNQFMMLLIYLIIGSIIGNLLKIDERFDLFMNRFKKIQGRSNGVNQLMNVIILQNVGSMALIGPLNYAFGDPSILLIKIVLDSTSGIIFGARSGFIIIIAGLVCVILESIAFFLSTLLQSILTTEMITQINMTAGALIFMLGLDMLEIKKINVLVYLPALLMPFIYHFIAILH